MDKISASWSVAVIFVKQRFGTISLEGSVIGELLLTGGSTLSRVYLKIHSSYCKNFHMAERENMSSLASVMLS